MRISIWSHDSNPAVDPRLYKQSLSRCEEGVAIGSLRWIDPSDKSRGCLVAAVARRSSAETLEDLIAAEDETSVNAAITDAESQANVGVADSYGAIYRAQQKIRAYPSVRDDQAVTAFGRWYDSASIQVTVTP